MATKTKPNNPNQVVHTTREVIEHKLLTALEDAGSVAALFSKQDLEDLIHALKLAMVYQDPSPQSTRLFDLQAGMEQLLKEAFPPSSSVTSVSSCKNSGSGSVPPVAPPPGGSCKNSGSGSEALL